MEDMDIYGNYYYRGGSGLWRSLRDGDFEESEVWDVLRSDQTRHSTNSDVAADEPSAFKHTPSSAKKIPRSSNGGGSTTPRSIFAGHQSAPVNIPNWSHARRTGRSKSSKVASSSMHAPWKHDDDYDEDGGGSGGDDDDDDDDEEEEKMLPPHEYIAMRVARSKISSFSVLEGVGRKLKGRELSKVRNHVLTKTGFLESPNPS